MEFKLDDEKAVYELAIKYGWPHDHPYFFMVKCRQCRHYKMAYCYTYKGCDDNICNNCKFNSVVYFMQHPDRRNAVKIGCTTNMVSRLHTYRSKFNFGCIMKILGTIKGGIDLERELHLRFRDNIIPGKRGLLSEWFYFTPELKELILFESEPFTYEIKPRGTKKAA